MYFTNLEKTDMVLIYGEARGHSELAPRIYRERFPQRILPNSRTFVNIVQHLRDFGHFEINKRGLGRQPEDCIHSWFQMKKFFTKFTWMKLHLVKLRDCEQQL
jgi:hypothetical protein